MGPSATASKDLVSRPRGPEVAGGVRPFHVHADQRRVDACEGRREVGRIVDEGVLHAVFLPVAGRLTDLAPDTDDGAPR